MLKDKRDDYKDVPWQQGRMLWTAITRRMDAAFHREAEERESRSLFAHFTAEDEGRGRVLLWHYDTAEECAAAVEQHNRELAARLKTPNVGVQRRPATNGRTPQDGPGPSAATTGSASSSPEAP